MNGIQNMIQLLFPQLNIHSISKLGFGNDSEAVLVNNEIVFKIPKHQKASNNLSKEKQILDIMKDKITLPIPHVQYYAILPNGFAILGYNKINGKTLTKEAFDLFTEKQKDNLAKQIAGFLGELHQVKVINYRDFLIDTKVEIETEYKTFMYKFSRFLTLQQINTAKALFESILIDESLYRYCPVLVHNDFSAGNILFDESTNSISGIIDFGDAAITDRDNDFLCLLEDSDEEYGRDFGNKVLQYYGLHTKEIEIAIKKADIKNELWPYEEMLLADEYNDKSMFESGLKKLNKR